MNRKMSIYQINENVVYVQGAMNGAIYDFNDRKVYSINNVGCEIINRLYLQNQLEADRNFLDQLKSMGLICQDEVISLYQFPFKRSLSTALKTVWLEITQACNLKCVHCYEGNTHFSDKNALSLEEWYKVIDQLSDLGVSHVIIIGGEPCSHCQIMDIMRYVYSKNIRMTLFTNATMLSDELKEFIISHNVIVKFSLYGPSAEIHDKITRCPGSFDKLQRNIRYLSENEVETRAAVVAMRENEDTMAETKRFAESIGAKYTRYDVIRNVFGGHQDEHTPLNPEVLKRAMFSKPNFRADINIFTQNYYYNSCWFGKLAIIENGDVIPCVFERDIICGNIRSVSVANILKSSKLKDCWEWGFDHVKPCNCCEFRFACKDCRPLGKSIAGNIEDKNPRCQYNPLTGVWG